MAEHAADPARPRSMTCRPPPDRALAEAEERRKAAKRRHCPPSWAGAMGQNPCATAIGKRRALPVDF